MTTAAPVSLTLALIAIGLFGLLFGILLALLGVMAYMLHKAASSMRMQAEINSRHVVTVMKENTAAIDKMRGEVALSLSRMDADRLHDAATQIQTGAKALAQQTTTLSRLLFAAAGQTPQFNSPGPLAGFPDQTPMDGLFSMEDEAKDDEQMLAERARWNREHWGQAAQAQAQAQQGYTTSPPSPLNVPIPNAFAGLSQAQINQRIEAFFERRRNGIVDPVADSQVEQLAERMSGAGQQTATSGSGLATPQPPQPPLPDLADGYTLDSLAEGVGPSFGMPGRGELDE